MLVLGIETSCDETAVALVSDKGEIRAEVVLSQLEDHRPFGGVVPEIAARAHAQHIDSLTAEVMKNTNWQEVDAIAATAGPGLIGGVMVGATFGKMLAAIHNKPFIAVNHLEGHALAARLVPGLAFPYLLLLVSGGHCQLLAVEGVGRYKKLGGTIDDAVGEAFDKVAKLLGLPYPGGPALEKAALTGDATRFALPRPMLGRKDCDFSFSGLKTAVRTALSGRELTPELVADMAASFQAAVLGVLLDRVRRAWEIFPAPALVASGGVAAKQAIRAALADLALKKEREFVAPPLRYCTDNAAMIAWAGIERLRLGQSSGLDFAPRPRWPLEAMNSC